MPHRSTQELADALRPHAKRVDLDRIADLVGDARFVLIGEASHGTHEFYATRAEITRRLIERRGFNAVAVEADWPDAYRVNRFVRGEGDGGSPMAALSAFSRFPTWMWRNRDVLDFVGWLRAHNDGRPRPQQAGFYGLDLYSLHGSIRAVLGYLDKVDPEGAAEARRRYACFDGHAAEPQAYGMQTTYGRRKPCAPEVLQQLVELQRRRGEYFKCRDCMAEDEHFYAEQNAAVVRDAERYYRSMFGDEDLSWNLRDTHMADTLDAMATHLSRDGREAKVVVWAHNSHLGDARATDVAGRGEINLGQLARQRHDGQAFLLGFTTYAGEVRAADTWDAPGYVKRVNDALAGSVEDVMHGLGQDRFLLDLRALPRDVTAALAQDRLHRAIGVIYLPQSERQSHYYHTRLPEQFEAVIHVEQTTAVEELAAPAEAVHEDVPELFPSGV